MQHANNCWRSLSPAKSLNHRVMLCPRQQWFKISSTNKTLPPCLMVVRRSRSPVCNYGAFIAHIFPCRAYVAVNARDITSARRSVAGRSIHNAQRAVLRLRRDASGSAEARRQGQLLAGGSIFASTRLFCTVWRGRSSSVMNCRCRNAPMGIHRVRGRLCVCVCVCARAHERVASLN